MSIFLLSGHLLIVVISLAKSLLAENLLLVDILDNTADGRVHVIRIRLLFILLQVDLEGV